MDGGCLGQVMRIGLLTALVGLAACGLIREAEAGLACQQPPAPDEILDADRAVPELVGLTPDAAAARLDEAEVVASWRYTYATNPNDTRVGYSECWCIPPPDGVVTMVDAEPGSRLIVFVEGAPISGGRDQPRLGWGCDEA